MKLPIEAEVTVVGAGFTGLSAAYELARQGIKVVVLEAENSVGGLAAAFEIGDQKLERFYHHWFTNDREVMELVQELGLQERVVENPTNTGIYYANNFFKLSTPWDLLRFKPLPLLDRFRLGLLTLRARRVKEWQKLEGFTARNWLRTLGGERVYRVVWEPLLKGKFGPHADEVSAVWFWNKLKLRGGSRGKTGEERLAYIKGSFAVLAETLARRIEASGGQVLLGTPARAISQRDGRWCVATPAGELISDKVVATIALPLIAELIGGWAGAEAIERLNRIRYLGNVCLILELERSLSETYWLNVNDPSFPFVGVIEHTNFESPSDYGGRHIVYLSKYLPPEDPLFSMDADQFLDYSLPYLRRMFPTIDRSMIKAHHLWRARWSQPLVECHYSSLMPPREWPAPGLYLCSMAQIYPEDRGTNYAIREGRRLGRDLAADLLSTRGTA